MGSISSQTAQMQKGLPLWAVVLSVSLVILAAGTVAWITLSSSNRPVIDTRLVDRQTLTKIEPPSLPPELASSSHPMVQAAITDYKAGRFAEASAKFHHASLDMPAAAPLRYLLGACYMMTNDTGAGMTELRGVLRMHSGPYSDAARLMLAKAYVRRDQDAEATEELLKIIKSRGPLEDDARVMLAQLRSVRD